MPIEVVGEGVLKVNDIECRYMTARDLTIQQALPYVDTFGLMKLFETLNTDPVTHLQDPANILLTGPKGNGKSLMFAAWSQQKRIPYLSLDCSEETKERHFKGGFVAKSGTTPFVLGTIANAIQVANDVGVAMLVLEEINALTPQRQKDLNALTDFRRKLEVPEISHRFELRPGAVLFIGATMNPSAYGGTYELNEDLKSRFVEIEVPYPPEGAEKRILKAMAPKNMSVPDRVYDLLVAIARETRQDQTAYSLSPRDLVQILHAVCRVGWDDALFLAVQKFSDEDRKLVIERIKDVVNIDVMADLKQRVLRVAGPGGA